MKIFQENKDKIFPNIFYIFYNKNEFKPQLRWIKKRIHFHAIGIFIMHIIKENKKEK